MADRSSRYGRYHGGPDPLAPPIDLAEALDAVASDVMAGYSPERALREYLRRGASGRQGLDDLARAVRRRREELLKRHSLGGTLDEVRKLLDEAVLEERKQLARDASLDDDDRAFRELRLDNLPSATAAAVSELASYDWQSTNARAAYERIRDLLGRELLDQRFAGMKAALEGATDEDRRAVAEMLRDLNQLLDAHRRGEDTPEDFDAFMAKHGAQFPEQPRTVEELIDALAKRAAAAQRMMNSLSREQRAELMALASQAFGSADLMAELAGLDANLQALRPGEDWSGSERFSGDEGLGLGDGTGVLADLSDLDALGEQLDQEHRGASLDDIDLDALGRQLGEEAAASARTLAELERALRDGGYLRRDADGGLRLSPQAMRRLGRSLLRDAARRLSGRQGARDSRLAGASGDLTGATRPYAFGDTQSWDVTRTITNAVLRTSSAGREVAGGVRIELDDIEVSETETRTQAAVALLVDTSYSMAAEGRWVPMKRTALALHHLVSTRFRGDRLRLVGFGLHARTLDIERLTALPPVREQGTNLHHGLLLASRFFREHPTMQPVLLVVTDGEPTARLLADGTPWFSYPPEDATLRATVAELDRLGRSGAQVTFFRLGDDPGLRRFLDRLAERVDGRVVAPELDDLGAAVVGEYLRRRLRWGDGPDWAG